MSIPPERISSIESLVRRLFGADVRSEVTQTTIVGVNPTRIAPQNPRRVLLHIVNNGTANVFHQLGNSKVVAGTGDFTPPGGFTTWLVNEDGESVGYELWGVSSSAGQQIDFIEVMIV